MIYKRADTVPLSVGEARTPKMYPKSYESRQFRASDVLECTVPLSVGEAGVPDEAAVPEDPEGRVRR